MNPAHRQQARSAPPGPGKQKQGMFVSRTFKRLLLAGSLLALAGPAFALGLGRIEVRSQQGQPLLAEIPVVSSDPAELRQLQARLASPETFARIGLEPPRGVVSDLQFNVALDRSGRPVIRVTSAAPVTQEALTFLVEVDWGQGRLVREYSALVAVPDTVAAPAQPTIQAPVAAPAPSIVRPPVAPAPAAQQAAAPVSPTDDDAIATTPSQPTPTPAPTPAPVARAADAAVTPGDALPAVRAGQTLSSIAAPLAEEAGISVNQAMLLLLRTNPEAFIGGNLNLIRQGAVLRVPARDAWNQFSAAEANAVVREQVGQWREMRRPAPQPAEPVADATAPAAATAPTATPRTADARLEITPPASDSQPAGTQSGIAAGAGGDMLRQELQQANETVAARTAEIDELKARLDDLEQLQQQQQQLIQLKDAELAAAQQRMEASNQQQASVAAPMPWLWLGVAILVVAALAFLLGRRGRAPVARRPFDSAALAAGMPTASPASTAPAVTVPEPATPAPAPAFVREAPAPAPVVEAAPIVSPVSTGPTWHAPSATSADDASVPGVAPVPAADPAGDAPVELDTGDAVDTPIGVERVELARAYIDLGDTETARSLMMEVVDGDDLAAAAQAAQLLRTLD
ncbi:FimV/HubP family polar landmark protein [Luteimonas sp. 9C]|uniref:FimV/HubP family polar landmark protein n=1 Tax=Luteimonas sp. 9C TaxID=2653148 RepID=UPI001F377362|nr:FimV/HubP family polar landmark protein [Luteimonas sp. 9C]